MHNATHVSRRLRWLFLRSIRRRRPPRWLQGECRSSAWSSAVTGPLLLGCSCNQWRLLTAMWDRDQRLLCLAVHKRAPAYALRPPCRGTGGTNLSILDCSLQNGYQRSRPRGSAPYTVHRSLRRDIQLQQRAPRRRTKRQETGWNLRVRGSQSARGTPDVYILHQWAGVVRWQGRFKLEFLL